MGACRSLNLIDKEALCFLLVCEKPRKLNHTIVKRWHSSPHAYSMRLLYPYLTIQVFLAPSHTDMVFQPHASFYPNNTMNVQ